MFFDGIGKALWGAFAAAVIVGLLIGAGVVAAIVKIHGI